MTALGLGGGIGSGKSAVADLLVAKGALLIDADQVARDVVAPGGPAYQPLVDRFGPGILTAEGTIDRPALAKVVFGDPEALADLNAITHPAIRSVMAEARHRLDGPGRVVVLAIPLLKEEHRREMQLDATAVVDCPVEVAIERLVSQRGMDRADAEARVAAQDSREVRLQVADYVVDNSSTREHLEEEVDRLWEWLGRLVPDNEGAPRG